MPKDSKLKCFNQNFNNWYTDVLFCDMLHLPEISFEPKQEILTRIKKQKYLSQVVHMNTQKSIAKVNEISFLLLAKHSVVIELNSKTSKGEYENCS